MASKAFVILIAGGIEAFFAIRGEVLSPGYGAGCGGGGDRGTEVILMRVANCAALDACNGLASGPYIIGLDVRGRIIAAKQFAVRNLGGIENRDWGSYLSCDKCLTLELR